MLALCFRIMNITELYIRFQTRYDSLTKKLSVYFYGDKYRLQRMKLNIFIIVAVVIISAVYSFIQNDSYYIIMALIVSFFDFIAIGWKYFRSKQT